jgi:hypothetical protein
MFDHPSLPGFEHTRALIERAQRNAAEGWPPFNSRPCPATRACATADGENREAEARGPAQAVLQAGQVVLEGDLDPGLGRLAVDVEGR